MKSIESEKKVTNRHLNCKIINVKKNKKNKNNSLSRDEKWLRWAPLDAGSVRN